MPDPAEPIYSRIERERREFFTAEIKPRLDLMQSEFIIAFDEDDDGELSVDVVRLDTDTDG